MKKMTHTGSLRCSIWKEDRIVDLRETKMYFIDCNGTKYKKKNGYLINSYVKTYAAPYLLLQTVKPIE